MKNEKRSQAGIALLEVTIAAGVLAVVAMGLTSTMVTTMVLRHENRERAEATQAVIRIMEQLQALPFERVYSLLNEDPADDPAGPGTAPGSQFAIRGINTQYLQAAINGLPMPPQFHSPPSQHTGPGTLQRTPMDATITFPQHPAQPGVLREDATDERLALPMDLNGDGVIDGSSRAGDYMILPLFIKVAWQTTLGERSLEFPMLLTRK